MKNLIILFSVMLLSHSGSYAMSTYVTSYQSLKNAIEHARPYDTIIIEEGAKIDFTDEKTIVIDKPISLKGDLGYSKIRPRFISKGKNTILKISANDVQVSNINFEGAQRDTKKEEIIAYNRRTGTNSGVYQYPVTKGIHVTGHSVTVSGVEISGFSHAGIFVDGAKSFLVENAKIHHNQRWGLGYGVCLNSNATAKILDSDFDYNRHSIAGSGSPGQSYEAAYNVFGDHHTATPLDMHGGKDRGDGTNIAGHTVNIHNNRIYEVDHYIFIHRGIAQNKVIITRNYLRDTNKPSFIGYYNVRSSDVGPEKFYFDLNYND